MRIIRIDNKGWRARFDDGFDEQNLSRIADAFGYIWADANPGATIYVGYDTRYEGRAFAGVVAGVLATYGLNVVVSDAFCPTPALGWAVSRDERAAGGVMLTASGAASEIGGVTARAADGGPIAEDFYESATRIMSSTAVSERGSFTYADIVGPYLKDLEAQVDSDVIRAADLNVVVDPLFGAGRTYLARVLRNLGCRVHEVHGEERVDFDGLTPQPTLARAATCAHAVRSYGCDLGVVLDGDADRFCLVDERGTYVSPHRSEPLLIAHLVENKGAEGRVVATYSSSAMIAREAERTGCDFTAVPMGFVRIYREFIERDVILGLDAMGGVCVPSHLPERDGLLAALLLVEARAYTKKTVSEMVHALEEELGEMHYVVHDIELSPSQIEAFRVVLPGINLREVLGMEPVWVGHADGLVLEFEDGSWVQLRPSRTEPLVRARAEAPDKLVAERLGEVACREALAALP